MSRSPSKGSSTSRLHAQTMCRPCSDDVLHVSLPDEVLDVTAAQEDFVALLLQNFQNALQMLFREVEADRLDKLLKIIAG